MNKNINKASKLFDKIRGKNVKFIKCVPLNLEEKYGKQQAEKIREAILANSISIKVP